MEHLQAALTGHGIWVVLGLVLASGAGLPLPAPPVLLAAGVLAGAGRLSLVAVLGGSLLALLWTDLLWYQLGRWRGRSILGFLCRISLEPDSCVQRTEDIFSRYRGGALLVSKFVPGLKTAAPPLAGLIGMPVGEFALYGGAGSLLWTAAFVLPGYLFSERIARAAPVGVWVAAAASLAFAAWLGWKILQRRRQLKVGRVTPDELFAQQESGRAVLVVDLRHAQAIDTKVRGARRHRCLARARLSGGAARRTARSMRLTDSPPSVGRTAPLRPPRLFGHVVRQLGHRRRCAGDP